MELNDYVTVGLAIAMLILGWRQHAFQKKIENQRSNNDFHNEKMDVYVAAANILTEVHLFSKPNRNRVEEFRTAILDSAIYFDEEIEAYLIDILRGMNRLIDVVEEAKTTESNEELTLEADVLRAKWRSELGDGKLKKKFKPYLQVGKGK